MGLFCDHDWRPRTGMDSGSYCPKCKDMTDREIDVVRSGGLNNGTLKDKNEPTVDARDEKAPSSIFDYISNLF